MKLVTVKSGTRICNTDLGGCGRQVYEGEQVWRQISSRRKKEKRRFLCVDCGKKVYIDVPEDESEAES